MKKQIITFLAIIITIFAYSQDTVTRVNVRTYPKISFIHDSDLLWGLQDSSFILNSKNFYLWGIRNYIDTSLGIYTLRDSVGSGWSLIGNAGTSPSTNFIGTTNYQDLEFRVNDSIAGYLNLGNGNTDWGLLTPGNTGSNNTFIGSYAGHFITGNYNAALGYNALKGLSSYEPSYCIAIGNGAMSKAAANCEWSVGVGVGALEFNNTWGNAAFGDAALNGNSTGNSNTANGIGALTNNQTGSSNTAIGYYTIYNNNTGSNLTAVGAGIDVYSDGLTNSSALGEGVLITASNQVTLGNYSTTDFLFGQGTSGGVFSATYCTALGYEALSTANTGINNTALGYNALGYNSSGTNNTASGYAALFENTTGSYNTAYGVNALYTNTDGYENTALGYQSLYYNDGHGNTHIGFNSAVNNTTGNFNSSVGYGSLSTNITGTFLTALGTGADVSVDGLTNSTAIGSNATITSSNQMVFGGGSITDNEFTGYINAATGNTLTIGSPGLGTSLLQVNTGYTLIGDVALTDNGFGFSMDGITLCSIGNGASTGSAPFGFNVLSNNGGTEQFGMGTKTPDASAVLDVESTTQGFLPPQMTTTQILAISSPKEGLIIYNLTTHRLNVYTNTGWTYITGILGN